MSMKKFVIFLSFSFVSLFLLQSYAQDDLIFKHMEINVSKGFFTSNQILGLLGTSYGPASIYLSIPYSLTCSQFLPEVVINRKDLS